MLGADTQKDSETRQGAETMDIARFNLIQTIPTIVLFCSQTVYVLSRQVFVQAARGRYGEYILHTRRMADRTIPEVHVFQKDLPS